jgi:thiaminase/transcriptional activator TenA
LPCFWIYRKAGNYIFKHVAKNNIYQKWIDTYSGEEFARSVDGMIDITDYTAETVFADMQNKMIEKFVYSVKM